MSGLGSIYLGAAIEVASERAVLTALAARLKQARSPFVMIANVQIRGRQIDCIAASASSATLIEVKVHRTPVRGAFNGPWGRLGPRGSWRTYGKLPSGFQDPFDEFGE